MAVCRLIGSFPSASSIAEGRGASAAYQGPNALALSRAQVKLGNEVHVITRGDGRTEEVEGIVIHRVPPPYNLNAFLEVLRVSSPAEAKLIHAHATTAYSIALAKRLVNDISLVVHVHGTTIGASLVREAGVSKSFVRSASISREKLMWRRAKCLLAVSENIRDEVVRGYGVDPHRVRVVHNGVDSQSFRPAGDREEIRNSLGWSDKQVILYVGQLSPRKGLDVLIRASKTVAENVKGAKVVVVGGVPDYQEASTRAYVNSLEEYAGTLGLKDVVEFFGAVPNSELPRIYSAADVFVLPSLYEGMPKSMLEAMACAKACVASDLVGIGGVLSDDVGVRVPPGDWKGLAAALTTLLGDEGQRSELGKRAREKVVRELTWEKVAQRVQEIYAEVV